MSALVPKMKEAGSAVFIAMVPLMLGYLVGLMAPITGTANDPLPLALSFFPLTAPIVMIMRLTNSAVPLWQILLSAILMYLTAYFSGQPPLFFRLKIYFLDNLFQSAGWLSRYPIPGMYLPD